MRTTTLIPLFAAAAALAACASRGPPPPSYTQEVEAIRMACEARGGMIIPTGRITMNPALDHPCRIHNATQLPPRG